MRTFTKNALKILLILAVCHALVLTYLSETYHLSSIKHLLYDLFYFEKEKNIPSLFSGLLLLYSGYILIKISQYGKAALDPKATHWKVMAYVFIFLACDEWFVIHESFNKIPIFAAETLEQKPTWILFYAVPLLGLSAYYLPFFQKMPVKTLVKMFAAAACFLFGATFLEFINYGVKYPMMVLLEDGFEIIGTLIFIETLLDYAKTKYQKDITIPKKIFKWILILTSIEIIITQSLDILGDL